MKSIAFVLSKGESLLRDVLTFKSAADVTVSRFFKANPKMGMRERGVVAEVIYTILRNKLLYNHISQTGSGSMHRRLLLLGLLDVVGIDKITSISDDEHAWLLHVLTIDRLSLSVALQVNFPTWLFDKLQKQYGQEQLLLLAQSLNQSAPLDLRVNTLKMKKEAVKQELLASNIVFHDMDYAPHGIRLDKKIALQNLSIFKEGVIEVQDEGSQLLAQLVGAKRGEFVIDFCAGAGGKTLALGDAMRNTGRLYAFDVSEKRLSKMKPRLARSGLSNVHPIFIAHENDIKVKRLANKADRVLIDAPCSGLGTLRRNPDLKWRQTEQTINELVQKQRSILHAASSLVKKGGRLIYATCSLLSEENEQVIESFLKTHSDFELIDVNEVLVANKIFNLSMDRYLRLLPHIHKTDGFFACVLQKK